VRKTERKCLRRQLPRHGVESCSSRPWRHLVIDHSTRARGAGAARGWRGRSPARRMSLRRTTEYRGSRQSGNAIESGGCGFPRTEGDPGTTGRGSTEADG
jgi:hypothetical protein